MRRPSIPLLSTSWRGLLLSALLFMGGLALAASPHRKFTGRVVAVTDGDTIRVMEGGESRKIRLYGVDSPEKKQDYGMKAKQFTSSLVFGKDVTVTVMANDRYGRIVGIVTLQDGRNLNQELVRNGYAWWYTHYAPHDRELAALETQARDEKRQLWSKPNAVPPWVFRRKR